MIPAPPTTTRFGPWIDGAMRLDPTRTTATVVAPFDGVELAQVEVATEADVDGAVERAAAAFAQHRFTPGHERASWLRAAADTVDEARDELTDTLVRVLGKPRRMSAAEVTRGVELLRLGAEEIARFGGETLPLDGVKGGEGLWGLTRREPHGVVAAITPFNAPVNLLLQKVAPALAVGNAVVVKPAPEGAVTALQVAQLLGAALPPGLVQVLPGDVPVVERLVAHPSVRAVSLTGGVAAGENVLRRAGIKPVLLELGSNAPNLVCADADLADAARRIAAAAFGASGQQCISAQRVIVEAPVAASFAGEFVAAAAALTVGDPDDPATELGPLVSWRRKEHVDRFLADAEARGGRLLLDGRRDDLLYGPTIVADLPRDALLRCEEVFGPVALLVTVADLDAAIAEANDSDLGLQAACFTASLSTAMHAAERLEAGSVLINEPTRFRLDTYPFGGVKRSGIGREGVRAAMEALTQTKFVGIRRL